MEALEHTSETSDRSYLENILGGKLVSVIFPYFEKLDTRFSEGIIGSIRIVYQQLTSLDLSNEDKKNIALGMLLSDLGKAKEILTEWNTPSAERYFIHELYAFDQVLTQDEKKGMSLQRFFQEKLIPFVHDKGENTERLEQGYRKFLESDRLRTYCESHKIDINAISMSQAWSIFHVLMGEEVWNEIETTLENDSHEKSEFQSARKLAELHHSAEGVFIEKVRGLSESENKQLGVIILIDKIESYRGRMKSNIIPIHGKNITEELRTQWELDEHGHYVANTDLVHINSLITLFQTSQFPEKVKKIFLSRLWEIYPHLLRRTKVVESTKVADLLWMSVERILSMNPQELEKIINTDELRVAIRELFRNGSLEKLPHVNAWQRKNDVNQKAVA